MIRSDAELMSIRSSVALVGRLSDGIVNLGPFNLGLDGVLSWIPAVGELYSLGAGVFILAQGARAGVPASVLMRAAMVLGARTLGDAVPLAGPVFADLFTAHKWAANLVVKAIDKRLASSARPTRGGSSPSRNHAGFWKGQDHSARALDRVVVRTTYR